jgi:hypothetical protein
MTKSSRRTVLRRSSALKRYLSVAMLLVTSVLVLSLAKSAEAEEYKTAGGLTVYLGVVPAEIVKVPGPHSAERPMHGGTPRGSHEYHIVVAVYDSVSNTRISDATVTAKVSGLGLSGPQKTLEQMKIAGTITDGDIITYGAFFSLTPDLYAIRLSVQRPGSQPVALEFKYDHRR